MWGQKEKLSLDFTQVSQENQALKARLSSVEELKKAIKEVKRQMRSSIVEIKQEKETKTEAVIEGNRGFLLKEGKIIYPAKVKIEVVPAIKN